MHSGIFILLFAIFFVLIGVVVWSIKDARPTMPKQESNPDEEPQETVPPDPDEAIKWLEDFAERQANSGDKRIH